MWFDRTATRSPDFMRMLAPPPPATAFHRKRTRHICIVCVRRSERSTLNGQTGPSTPGLVRPPKLMARQAQQNGGVSASGPGVMTLFGGCWLRPVLVEALALDFRF